MTVMLDISHLNQGWLPLFDFFIQFHHSGTQHVLVWHISLFCIWVHLPCDQFWYILISKLIREHDIKSDQCEQSVGHSTWNNANTVLLTQWEWYHYQVFYKWWEQSLLMRTMVAQCLQWGEKNASKIWTRFGGSRDFSAVKNTFFIYRRPELCA